MKPIHYAALLLLGAVWGASFLFIGVAVAIFSATTQIQEQTLSFVPKMIAVFAILAATGPWVGATMMRFAARCLGGFLEVMQ